MPADVYSLSVVLPLHNALLSKRGTPVNLFTRLCKQICKCGIYHLCTGFAPQFANFCITFAPSKFGANPFFRPDSCFINIKTYGSFLISFVFILFYLYLFLQRQTLILPYIKVRNIHLIHERRLLHASVISFAANLI